MHFDVVLYKALYKALFVQRPSVFPREHSGGAVQALYRGALRTAPKAKIGVTFQNDHTLV